MRGVRAGTGLAVAFCLVMGVLASIAPILAGPLGRFADSGNGRIVGPPLTSGASFERTGLGSVLPNPAAFHPRFAHPFAAGPYPVGLSDTGMPGGSVTTHYTTSSFLASVHINSLGTTGPNASVGSGMTFQLNVNLGFTVGSTVYDYWVQDVAFVDTSVHEVTQYEDNIWNFSSPSECLSNSDVSGGGSVYPFGTGCVGYYATGVPVHDFVNPTGDFQMMVNASVTAQGHPSVDFRYDDGSGWVTYDSASFPWAHGTGLVAAFVVDGSQFNPTGYLYYDAEIVMGGPGNGWTTNLTAGSTHLSLESWNGNDFASVANAVNSGFDTAETIGHAASSANHSASDGSLFASVAPGTESQATLWNQTQIAYVQVNGPGTNRSILHIGTAGAPYVGGLGRFAVAPLVLPFNVTYAGFTQSLGVRTLVAGNTTVLNPGTWANLDFVSAGIGAGTVWGVAVGTDARSGPNASEALFLPLGTYSYRVSGGSGYLPSPSAGSATVFDPAVGPSVVAIGWQAVVVTSNTSAHQADLNQSVGFSTALNGTAGDSFSWTGLPGGCHDRNASSVACVLTLAGPYSVVVTIDDPHGFQTSSVPVSFNVFLDPAISPPIGQPRSVDSGQRLSLSTTYTAGSGGDRFVWSGLPGGCASQDSASLSCAPQAGTFSVAVTLTDSDGFVVVSGPLNLTVFAAPTISPPTPSSSSADVGQPVTFVAPFTPGSGGDNFVWSGLPAGCRSANSSQVTCTPHGPGTFSVRVSLADSNGGSANATASLVVHPLPGVTDLFASPDSSVLLGQGITITANVAGGSGDTAYVWNGLPDGCSSANSSRIECTPSAAGTWTVSVSVTDSNHGTNTSSALTVTVQSGFLGLPAVEGYALVGVVVGAALAAGALVVVRRSRRRRTEAAAELAEAEPSPELPPEP